MEQNHRHQMEEYQYIIVYFAEGRDCFRVVIFGRQTANKNCFIRIFILANYVGANKRPSPFIQLRLPPPSYDVEWLCCWVATKDEWYFQSERRRQRDDY